MTLSIIPTADELFQSARSQILLQHEALRPRLRSALTTARRASLGDAQALDDLPGLIIVLLGDLKSHMAYEESVLLPIFSANGPQGAGEATALAREHVRQREEFATLIKLAMDKVHAADLALALQSLVSDVLADMGQEEQKMASETITVEHPVWALA